MTHQTGERRARSRQTIERGAHEEQDHAAASGDAQALQVGRAVLGLLAALGVGSLSTAARSYDQDNRPPGVSRRSFLDRHAARVREGVEGWTRAGMARVVTADAWELDVAAETARARRRPLVQPTPQNDTDDALDRALGIRTRRAR